MYHHNPFKAAPASLVSMAGWIGREETTVSLEKALLTRQNTILLGVEGSGKSSLLGALFNIEYRRSHAAGESASGVRPLIFPVDMAAATRTDMYEYLVSRLRAELDVLLAGVPGGEQVIDFIGREIDRLQSMQVCFTNCMSKLCGLGFRVVLIMDNFERFTFSKTINRSHHDVLCSLVDSQYLQCIAATNYDIQSDSLDPDIGGSDYLQRLTNTITLPGFSLGDALQFARSALDVTEQGWFSDYDLGMLWHFTGGNPRLYETALHLAYENARRNRGSLHLDELAGPLYDTCSIVAEHWCHHLTDVQNEVLDLLASIDRHPELCGEVMIPPQCIGDDMLPVPARLDVDQLDAAGRRAAKGLISRGLLLCPEGEDEQGWPLVEDGNCIFNSGLLEAFIRQRCDHVQEIPLPAQAERIAMIDSPGADPEMMRMWLLGMQQAFLAQQLPMLPGGDPEAEAELIEEAVGRITDSMGLQVTPEAVEESDSVTDVFRQDRAALGLEAVLPDSLMASMSNVCSYYIRAALRCDVMFGELGEYFDKAFVARMRMLAYGNAAEQALHDMLHPLLSGHPDLRDISFNPKCTSSVAFTFGTRGTDQVTIGNYQMFISHTYSELARLCRKNAPAMPAGLEVPDTWESWWKDYSRKLLTAKELRNLIHPGGNMPIESDIQAIRDLLFGASGILNLSQVPRALWQSYSDPDTCVPTDEVIASLRSRTAQMQCEEVTKKGVLRGKISIDLLGGKPMPAQIKKKHLKAASLDADSLCSKALTVRITGYDKQNCFLIVEPVL